MNLEALNKRIIQIQETLIKEQDETIKALEERERMAEGLISNQNKLIKELQKQLSFYTSGH